MDPVIITRHGERWAVKESRESAPIAEFDTREEAESDARQRAEDGREVVFEEGADDAQLGRVEQPDVEDSDLEPMGSPSEKLRQEQGGL